MNNKGADQTKQMHMRSALFVVRLQQNQVFLWQGPFDVLSLFISSPKTLKHLTNLLHVYYNNLTHEES